MIATVRHHYNRDDIRTMAIDLYTIKSFEMGHARTSSFLQHVSVRRGHMPKTPPGVEDAHTVRSYCKKIE
jgi:hypothetical protein